MILLKQILVATDFSDAAAAALAHARSLAKNFGATLHVLHVTENLFLRPVPNDPYVLKAAVTRQLNTLLTADDRETLHATAVLETSDNPAEVIVEYAKTQAIDLIVMGTHGRSGVARVLIGSVAETVVRTAPCPVLTVRQSETQSGAPDTLAVS